MKDETECLHAGYQPKNAEPRVMPIVQSTTYVYDSTEEVAAVFDDPMKSLIYSRFGNPTVMAVEDKIAELEGGIFHQSFFPFTEGFCYVPANDSRALYEAVDDTVCAVMIELVQGESGVNVLEKEYVKNIEKICGERDILLIVDEVQTGDHGSTFGGNPVACAGAVEVLNQVADKNFLIVVNSKSDYMYEKLSAMPNVTSVSGMGLMIGLSLKKNLKAGEIAKRCVENGLLILTAKEKLRIMPPLNILKEEIDKGFDILKGCLSGELS